MIDSWILYLFKIHIDVRMSHAFTNVIHLWYSCNDIRIFVTMVTIIVFDMDMFTYLYFI